MSFFTNVKSSLDSFTVDIKQQLNPVFSAIDEEHHSHTHLASQCHALHLHTRNNRFHSFAPERPSGNDAKWFVDGCGYMWAVSVAIEEARESIWILDWWLSPELYLRRPPAFNERYRLDKMLMAAAERGVKVNVIVYKEVAAVLSLCSEHTKKALQLHPNIAVFRHPDHTPSGQVLESEVLSTIKNFHFKNLHLADVPEDTFKALYGVNRDIILYWAHHEKLCLVDGNIAFMGGLDLCFGRWDTNQHPIADAHPTDLNQALFPGQDFNNARVRDFEDVTKWKNNKLDRTKSSRMGWSDLSICLRGPVVEDLKAHFVQRWNFIYYEKYDVQRDERYSPLTLRTTQIPDGYYHTDGKPVHHIVGDANSEDEDAPGSEHHLFHLPGAAGNFVNKFREKLDMERSRGDYERDEPEGMSIQLVRSCTRWSNGVATEHSIANAYIEIIKHSQHFIYIENQFFITATDDDQRPVRNKLGAALVERIVRAYQQGEKWKAIICMPSVPAFAGDLHADDSLGTRAIMEYQYQAICRGGRSIMEAAEKAGVPDATQYIRFYNLRNYDRINAGPGTAMDQVQKESGVDYESGRKQHDDIVGAGYDGRGEGTGAYYGRRNPEYEEYQRAGKGVYDEMVDDSVAECYMENGPSILNVAWTGSEEAEMDAFVSEELYIHSKILIADDRIAIIGSANLNDRSQLGYHDSEIAVVIEDPTPVNSFMNGRPYTAAKFAASLRRQLFRKHLGLLPAQDCTKPDRNFMPLNHAPNAYDWGSKADQLVQDPLSERFENHWNTVARINTSVFSKAFHAVPADNMRTWEQYEAFYQNLFVSPSKPDDKVQIKPRYEYGHVVKEEFPGGVRELKEWLSGVRGTLVEMPLLFMDKVDFAKEGLKLNALTDEVYT